MYYLCIFVYIIIYYLLFMHHMIYYIYIVYHIHRAINNKLLQKFNEELKSPYCLNT